MGAIACILTVGDKMNLTKTLFAAAAMTLIGGAASAATVTISVIGSSIEVDCDGSSAQPCYGLVGGDWDAAGSAATLSATEASLYDVSPNNPGVEAQALDYLIDGVDNDDFVASDADKTDAGGVDSLSFFSAAEYIAFKVGAGHFFLKLTDVGTVEISFDKNGASAGGLSHYTEFGNICQDDNGCEPPNEVPLPAAGWLMLAGIGGIAAVRRRRKAA